MVHKLSKFVLINDSFTSSTVNVFNKIFCFLSLGDGDDLPIKINMLEARTGEHWLNSLALDVTNMMTVW